MASLLILGATSDIAMAIAEIFARNNFNIVLACRNPARMIPFSEDLKIRFPINCTLLDFDATQTEKHSSIFYNLNPLPEITVCAFGYLGEQLKAESDWSESEKIINTNFTSAVSIINIIAQQYSAQKSGTIIGISSVAGDRGRQSNYIYGSAKAGFTTYLSGLRNKMYQFDVHVITVKPGFVETKMTEKLNLPTKLTAKPEDVANDIYKAYKGKKNIIYSLWFWRWIMLMIKLIPEFLFKKLKT